MKTTTNAKPSTEPSLYTTRPVFGVAGGPIETVLTDKGAALSFAIGAQVKPESPLGPALLALHADATGALSVRSGVRMHATSLLKRFDMIVWGSLQARGYVERWQDESGDGVRLTNVGRAAVQAGFEEQARLLDRCRRASA
jgi:hypothetical protein